MVYRFVLILSNSNSKLSCLSDFLRGQKDRVVHKNKDQGIINTSLHFAYISNLLANGDFGSILTRLFVMYWKISENVVYGNH